MMVRELNGMKSCAESDFAKDDILKQHVNQENGERFKRQLKNILGESYDDSAVSKALNECQTQKVFLNSMKKLYIRVFKVGVK